MQTVVVQNDEAALASTAVVSATDLAAATGTATP